MIFYCFVETLEGAIATMGVDTTTLEGDFNVSHHFRVGIQLTHEIRSKESDTLSYGISMFFAMAKFSNPDNM